ncbi:MAG: hypothetical protein WEB33_11455 [Bacteroidota bacterium]
MHLTQKEIQALADQSIDPRRKAELLDHAASCKKCSTELSFDRSLSQAIRTAPLHKTSAQFTAKVMGQVDPEFQNGLLFRMFGGAGRIVAMAAVLGLIAYIMTLNVPGSTTSGGGPATMLFGEISSYYDSAKEFLTSRSSQVNQTVDQRASGQGVQILAMTFVVLIALGLLDRFVLRHFVRMKV